MDDKRAKQMPSDFGNNSPAKRSINLYKVCTVILGIVALTETLGLITFAIMLCVKKLEIVSTMSGRRVAEIYNVCDGKTVARWNNIYSPNAKGETLNAVSEVNKLVDDVKKRPDYEKDPTCQYFVFQAALYNNDIKSMHKSFDAIMALNKRGSHINDNLMHRRSIQNMGAMLGHSKV